MLVTLERRVQILAISNCFEPSEHDASQRPLEESHVKFTQGVGAYELMLSHQDIAGLVHTLYPSNQVPKNPEDHLAATQASAPPSTTSSSTLRPGSSDVGSRASSMGPNYSGSSINSEATITGNPPVRPQGLSENLSLGMSGNEADTSTDNPEADPNKLAWQLWTLHAKLQVIVKNTADQTVGAGSPSRWAIFPIHPNGRVILKPSMPLNGLFASDMNMDQSIGSVSNIWILKEAIVTLLANQSRNEDGNPKCTQSPALLHDSLGVLLEGALAESRLSMDFGAAHYWHKCLNIYSNLTNSPGGTIAIQNLLNSVGKELQTSIDHCIERAQASESLIRSLSFLSTQQTTLLALLEGRRRALRIKMWYVSDVRHSSTYEEALVVTRALREMSGLKRNKQQGSTFNWARQRLRGALSQERADAQTLEAMTASRDCGGRAKLSDDQVEMTSRWLTRTGIENFCRGEERIHRFCYEIQKSVGKLAGSSLLESPVLWSSHLFKREKAAFDPRNPRAGVGSSSGLYSPPSFSYGGPWTSPTSTQYSLAPMTSPVSVGAHTSGRGHSLGIPTGGHNVFTPPSVTPGSRPTVPSINHPHSTNGNITMTRPGSRYDGDDTTERTSLKKTARSKELLVKSIKDALYGLLASDLGYLLWDQGSETDAWITKAAAEQQNDEKAAMDTVRSSLEVQTGEPQQNDLTPHSGGIDSQNLQSHGMPNADLAVHESNFGFSEVYGVLLHRMSATSDPFIKLEMLSQLEKLVVLSLHDSTNLNNNNGPSTHNRTIELQSESMSRTKSVPRTKATSLEEVVANCTERRAGTLRGATLTLSSIISTDAIVNHLLTIFRTSHLRPTNLFLSLQYIAAFIPPTTLDHTAHGAAFWNCALAALALKEDLCASTVRRAADITNAYIATKPTSPPFPPHQEAANLWLVAAKEGSPVAARELALFYLTHPDLLAQRVTMPLSRTREVFKSRSGGGDGGSGGGSSASAGEKRERERGGTLDPLTFDVVYHWMEIAANGGDEVARTFLRQG